MAGSQLSGVAHARADLFRGARYFLTPTDRTDPDAYREVSGFVRDLGAVPTGVGPGEARPPHGRPLAPAAPHGGGATQGRLDISPEALSFAGPLVQGPHAGRGVQPRCGRTSWRRTHRPWGRRWPFAGAMAQLGSEIKDREAMEQRFLQAREAYDALGGILVEKSGENAELAVPVENRPGVFAEVTTLMGSNNINILDLYVRHSNTERAALVLTVDAEAAQLARELLREAGFKAEIIS